MSATATEGERDIILTAIDKVKASFARLTAAAKRCTCPKARRLYNQLALDELRHLLTLVSLMDGVADDCLNQLDLTVPLGDVPETMPQSEEEILRVTMAEERRSQQLFAELAEESAGREEILALLEMLRAEEEDHLARLQSMLYGLEADRPVVAKWFRSIRRMAPTAYLQ